jgi:hypothetical protein
MQKNEKARILVPILGLKVLFDFLGFLATQQKQHAQYQWNTNNNNNNNTTTHTTHKIKKLKEALSTTDSIIFFVTIRRICLPSELTSGQRLT